jgi:hypothetical protein
MIGMVGGPGGPPGSLPASLVVIMHAESIA